MRAGLSALTDGNLGGQFNGRGRAALRKQAMSIAVATALGSVFAGVSTASGVTNITGFSGFSAVNAGNAAVGDANIGYQSNGTVFEITDGVNNENTSGFSPTALNLSNGFTATFSYQTIPQIPTTGPNGSLQADGMALVFQSATLGSTTALGNTGGSLGYTGMANQSNTAAVEFNLFDDVYTFHGGTSYQTGGAVVTGATLTPNLSTGDTVSVRLSLTGTTLQEYVVDTTTGAASAFSLPGVTLPTTLGTANAIIGFTGATGGINSTQKISNFSFTASPTYKPIIATGFNQNMVVPASAPLSGAVSSITASMDSGTANPANNVWYETGYQTATTGTTGLPASGSTFTSQNDANHIFAMQSYTGTGDAILLANGTNNVHTTGTLTFTTPAAYQSLSLLESSGNGPNYFNMIINYADGVAATTIADIIAPNWFNPGDQIAWDAEGRCAPGTGTTTFNNVNNGNPDLTQQDFSLPDTTDPIASITFTYASGGGNTAIFAVSGVVSTTTTILTYTGSQKPGAFDSTDFNFTNGTNINFSNGSIVQFDDTSANNVTNRTITVSPGIAPGGIIFLNTTATLPYTFVGSGIGGTGGVSLNANGTVVFDNSNTYTGSTIINAGQLVIGPGGNVASNLVVIASVGTLNVSGGTLSGTTLDLENSGTVLFSGTTQSFGDFNGSGSFTSTNVSGTSITLTGPGVYSGTANLGPGSVTVNTNGSTATLSGSNTYTGGTYLLSGLLLAGNNSLGTGSVHLQNGSIGAATTSVNVSNLMVGGALIAASGTNLLEISNSANTFTGPVVVQSGTLQIDSAGAIGGLNGNLATGVIDVASGATLLLNENPVTGYLGLTGGVQGGAPITAVISGSGINGNGALRGPDGGGSATWAGNINASGSAKVAPGSAGTLTLTGTITGTGPVIFGANSNDAGYSTTNLTPALPGSSNYSGESQIVGDASAQGYLTISLGANDGFSTASGLDFISPAYGATVNLNGFNQHVRYLTGVVSPNGNAPYLLTNTASSLSTLTISNGSGSTITTPITGNIAIVKTGTGIQTLAGANSYSGGTTITSGTLSAASATALGSGPIVVNGGTLGLAATLTPGSSIVNSGNFNSFTLNTGGAAVSPTVNGNTLQLTTNGTNNQANSAFYPVKVPVSDTLGFTATFSYDLSAGQDADGVAFVLQNQSANAVSATGGGDLGYAGTNAIVPSAAVTFEAYGGPKTSFTSNGSAPVYTTASSTAPVYFGSSQAGLLYYQVVDVTLVYNGPAKTLTETLYGETSETGFTATYTGIDYSALVGGTANGSTTAYVGFTGGTGGLSSTQTITNFSYETNLGSPQSISNPVNATGGNSVIQLGITSGSNSTGATVGQINISSGATVALAIPTGLGSVHGVLFTPTVSIATTNGAFAGKLDISTNDLVVTSSNLAAVTAMVASGYNHGTWTGQGIASTAAASDTTRLTAVGVILNDTNQAGGGNILYGNNGGISSTFDNSSPSQDNVLVKYTYYGDANLDGAVDGSDYSLVDAAYASENFVNGVLKGSPVSGWYNGDFNYDGVVNGSDYTLMDNAFNQQSTSLGVNPLAQLATSTALVAGGGSAVPEPTSLALLGVAAAGLLSRRRRRI